MQSPSSLTILAFPKEGQNPYQKLLYDAVESKGVIIREGSLKEIYSERYDIAHFHWPEFFLNQPNSWTRWRGFVKFLLSVLIIKLRRKKYVWTAHNAHAHEEKGGLLPLLFRSILFWACDGIILLSRASSQILMEHYPALRNKPLLHSWHGDYRPLYPQPPTKSAAKREADIANDPFVISFFGSIRPYKNVPHLIQTFQQLVDNSYKLLITGSSSEQTLGNQVRELASGDPRINLRIGFTPEAKIPLTICAADLMVLPFRDILNSGSSMLALSLNVPILVPAKGTLVELAQNVGPEWVRTYPDELTPEILADAIDWAKRPRPHPAPLEHYSWAICGRDTAEFLRAIADNSLQTQHAVTQQDTLAEG